MCISGQSRKKKERKKEKKHMGRNSGAADNEQLLYLRIAWYIYFLSSMNPFVLSNIAVYFAWDMSQK